MERDSVAFSFITSTSFPSKSPSFIILIISAIILLLRPDPGYATFLFEQLQRPGGGGHEAGASCCQVCSTPLHQLRQEALQTLHATIPILTLSSDMAAAPSPSFLPQPARFAASKGQAAAHGVLPLGERHRVPGWSSVSSGPQASVQVTVAGGQISGSLNSVTIQAQQYLEGMWSVSKANNFIPQPRPAHGSMGEAEADAAASEAPVGDATADASTPCRLRSSSQPGLQAAGGANTHGSPSPSSSAAASFFIR
ncbi:Kinesin-like protein KIF26A [Liparis tanakae]|uniref:Kinesin-like protein KIF26A n=1 Tax=Liparis tanakae TaxID=230148 RepID=A0A4Z2J2E4_9TELE|nr:Kinesin-like protein KIF26A [Liparis tanakae]